MNLIRREKLATNPELGTYDKNPYPMDLRINSVGINSDLVLRFSKHHMSVDTPFNISVFGEANGYPEGALLRFRIDEDFVISRNGAIQKVWKFFNTIELAVLHTYLYSEWDVLGNKPDKYDFRHANRILLFAMREMWRTSWKEDWICWIRRHCVYAWLSAFGWSQYKLGKRLRGKY